LALTVYKASAGSGKTFTLAKEFIKLLILNPQDFKHILAITFTKKATEEMKTRILENLLSLSKNEVNDMMPVLIDELGEGFDQDLISRRAEEAYVLIIHNYSRFEISTIDSFFSRVLKSFARELDLPLSYEVEMNQDLVLSESLESLYRSLDERPELVRWLSQFAKTRIEQDRTWNLDEDIKQLGRNLFSEKFQANFDQNKLPLDELEAIIDELQQEIKTFERKAAGLANQVFDLLTAEKLELSDFNYGGSGALAAFTGILKGDYEVKLKKRFMSTIEGSMQWGAKKSPSFEHACEVGQTKILPIATETLEFIDDKLNDYLTAKAIFKNIYSFGLLEALYQEVKNYRDEENILLISDTNKILKDVLDVADAPIMFEKLGSTYKHIMVDEFQDTSSFQWANLKPLIINALSQGHEVLIVGDVKQSIYRFRGGNMKLLLSQIKEDLNGFYLRGTDRPLESNYRSLSHVVDFNNTLFDVLPGALNELDLLEESDLFTKAFAGHRQAVKKAEGGYVELRFYKEETDWKMQAIDHLVASIKANEQDYGYGEMLILVDKNREITDIASRFLQEKIPFINGESLRLTQSELVIFIIELLHYLRSDKDEVRTLNLIILYERLTGSSNHNSFQRTKGERMTLTQAGFPTEFLTNIQSLKQRSLVDLIHQLLLLFDFEALADIYLQQFFDLVIGQSQKGNNSIASFLDWWDKEGFDETITTGEVTQAIRILTIHKAKGLEAPIVFIPFANWNFSPNARLHQFWTSHLPERYQKLSFIPLDFSKGDLIGSYFEADLKAEAEEHALDILNKTYVAFTRPREKLYCTAPTQTRQDKNGVNRLLLKLLAETDLQVMDTAEVQQFSLGNPHEERVKSDENDQVIPLTIYPKSLFMDSLSVRNDSERFFMLQATDQAQAITLGNQVHDILADITTKDELSMVLRQRQQAGEMTIDSIEEVKKQIEELLEHPQISDWFSDTYDSYNERVLQYQGQELKPDRLLLKRNEAIVIDYKTGNAMGSHVAQVKTYMEAVAAIGFEPKGYLLYISPLDVQEVRL